MLFEPTFVEECEAHVHEYLGRAKVFGVVALEESDSEELHEAIEDLLVHFFVVDALRSQTHCLL